MKILKDLALFASGIGLAVTVAAWIVVSAVFVLPTGVFLWAFIQLVPED